MMVYVEESINNIVWYIILHGITSGVIIPPFTIAHACGLDFSSYIYYCIVGSCQNNVTRFIDYMGCCGAPLLNYYFFNLTTCHITNTGPCPSGVVGFQSSPLFAALLYLIITFLWSSST